MKKLTQSFNSFKEKKVKTWNSFKRNICPQDEFDNYNSDRPKNKVQI